MNIIEMVKQDIAEISQDLIKDIIPIPTDKRLNYRGCPQVAELHVQIEGKPSVLAVGFPEFFPRELPKFFDRSNQYGRIPHKEKDGFICFTRTESLLIDIRHPGSILLNCLEKVVDLIVKGVRGENQNEFSKEFEAYWARQDNILSIFGLIDTANTQVRELDLWGIPLGETHLVIAAERGKPLQHVTNQLFNVNLNEGVRYRCLFLPLQNNTFIMPPDFNSTWDIVKLRENILPNLTKQNKERFYRLIGQRSKRMLGRDYVVIGLPISDGNLALFGYEFTYEPAQVKRNRLNRRVATIQTHPLVQVPKNLQMQPAEICRWHPHHLLNRTGGNPSLSYKHVVIVGTGAIGSEIVMRFAKAGVKQLTIIDHDWMEMENIHRHSLGYDQVYMKFPDGIFNKPKVLGLKEEINRRYPFTLVSGLSEKFEKVYQENLVDWTEVDLIIVAIGSPNQEMAINERFHKLSGSPPIIYTWVEPLGIGGHSLVTLNGVKEGCYQCLFQADDDNPIFNRSAFAKPFQTFYKTITGCGSTFTPYNFLDSEKTALMAVEIGMRVLCGNEFDNPLVSWKGDPTQFYQMGFESSPRFEFTQEKLNEASLLYKDPHCPVCKRGG